MPTDSKYKAGDSLPSPWKEFLSELDSMLPEPLDLHCIGGRLRYLLLLWLASPNG